RSGHDLFVVPFRSQIRATPCTQELQWEMLLARAKVVRLKSFNDGARSLRGCSGHLPPSPPAEQASARHDQAGQSSTRAIAPELDTTRVWYLGDIRRACL